MSKRANVGIRVVDIHPRDRTTRPVDYPACDLPRRLEHDLSKVDRIAGRDLSTFPMVLEARTPGPEVKFRPLGIPGEGKAELLKRGILVKNEGGGRSTSYRLADPGRV